MTGFNEADVLPSTVGALLREGVDVHYIDNWSTDATARAVSEMQRGLELRRSRLEARRRRSRAPSKAAPLLAKLTYERFPADGPTGSYDWGNILRRKEALSEELADADWVIHCDPDEIRESPWGPSVPLRRAVYIAQVLGFNQINFNNLVVFRPVVGQTWPHTTANAAKAKGAGLKESFVHYDKKGLEYDRNRQIKGWRRKFPRGALRGEAVSVDLASSGGHEAKFRSPAWLSGRVMPWSFVLRHYPIRSQAHGVRKVFTERKNRWNATERKAAWHAQYDDVTNASHSFVVDSSTLAHAPRGILPPAIYAQDVPCMEDFFKQQEGEKAGGTPR